MLVVRGRVPLRPLQPFPIPRRLPVHRFKPIFLDPNVNEQFRETEAGDRYAKAAFELAEDTKVLEAVYKDLQAVKAQLLQSAELRGFVSSYVYTLSLIHI